MSSETQSLLASPCDVYLSTSSSDSFQECRSQSSLECIPSSPTSKLEWVKDDTQKTTVRQTVFNIAKMCMGTGTLALPYAACQGGYIFNAAGLAIMMLWNLYSVDRLLRCLSLIPPDNNPRSVEDKENQIPDMVSLHTPTLEKVTFYAFGSWGVKIIDGISLTLYCGIITAYIDAMIGFISKTPVTTGSKYTDGILLFLFLVPLSYASDLKFLAQFSAMGIFILLSVQITLATYVISNVGWVGFASVSWNDLWPRDWGAISHWFGIVSFSMGVVPFTYTIQESMICPSEMKSATETAVWLIYMAYVCISNGVAMLVSPMTDHNVQGDILQLIPRGWIPTFVRLAMTLVIVVTAPLVLMPAGYLVESKFASCRFYSSCPLHGSGMIRIGILLCCLCLSILIHNSFVYVISFVGCFCVSLMSFVFPPLVHLKLYTRYNEEKSRTTRHTIVQETVMLCIGCFACIVTSCQTFHTLIQ